MPNVAPANNVSPPLIETGAGGSVRITAGILSGTAATGKSYRSSE
ncbi:MAG: hypothetical protein ACYTXI_40105 [Nostoc sp.]